MHYVRVYNTSKVQFSSQFNTKLACQMSFENYPVDAQECDVNIESYGHTIDRMTLEFNRNDNHVKCDIKLNQHDFYVVYEETDSAGTYSTGRISES